MNRPARVRDRSHLRGYVDAPALAWQGWRLSIPGGPEGGQYHGYIGPDSATGWPAGEDEIGPDPNAPATKELKALSGVTRDPWDNLWSGVPLHEGETMSDYVYRSPSEMRPRPNASGGTNVLTAYQRRRTAGFAVAPGNYKALGLMVQEAVDRGYIPDPCANESGQGQSMCRSAIQQSYWGEPPAPTIQVIRSVTPLPPVMACPDYVLAPCGPGTVQAWSKNSAGCSVPQGCVPGATNTVTQPIPGWPTPVYTIPQAPPPVSPAPAPTVPASPSDYLPSQGQPISSALPASTSTSDIWAWLQVNSIWSAVPNWVLVAGAAVVLFRGHGKK